VYFGFLYFCLHAALPDVTVHEVTHEYEFIVLACDGIWDVLSSQEAVDFVRVRIAQQMEPDIVSEYLYCLLLVSMNVSGWQKCDDIIINIFFVIFLLGSDRYLIRLSKPVHISTIQ